MTDIKIVKKQGSITKVTCSGHTGFASQGEDIVCAGVSTLTQTALLGLLQVAQVNVKFKSGDAFLEFELPHDLTREQRHDADVILNTMLCGLSDFLTEFSDYISLEVV